MLHLENVMIVGVDVVVAVVDVEAFENYALLVQVAVIQTLVL